jgi:hypothetical protein
MGLPGRRGISRQGTVAYRNAGTGEVALIAHSDFLPPVAWICFARMRRSLEGISTNNPVIKYFLLYCQALIKQHVMPAKAGIQRCVKRADLLFAGFRAKPGMTTRNDGRHTVYVPDQ